MKGLINLLENIRRHAPGEAPSEAEHHHFKDGKAACNLRELREVRYGAFGKKLAVFLEHDIPDAGREAGNGLEERCFPCRIAAGDGNELPRPDGKRNVVKNLFRSEINAEVLNGERERHQKSLRLFKSRTRRKGTPAMDVTMPIGSMAPAESHLAISEERSMMKPPARMLPGMSQR